MIKKQKNGMREDPRGCTMDPPICQFIRDNEKPTNEYIISVREYKVFLPNFDLFILYKNALERQRQRCIGFLKFNVQSGPEVSPSLLNLIITLNYYIFLMKMYMYYLTECN